MILTRQLIFMIYIVIYFVNLATSMEEAGTSSGGTRRRKSLFRKLKGIRQCKDDLYERGYIDDGAVNWERGHLRPGQSRYLYVLPSSELLYIAHLEREGRNGTKTVKQFCEDRFIAIAVLGKSRDVAHVRQQTLHWLIARLS